LSLTGVIGDRYAIERELGRGGMATVYLARDTRHGNRVAVKVLMPDFASVVSGERFTREIRITARLQHPHILPVFDSGQTDGVPYYVMPFVDGPTLTERIRNGPLPISEALEIACEVADALQYAHAEGIVHRDIKPSNILLAHGHAVVGDFGVARALESGTEQSLTRPGITVGTAAYMSPEQAAGETVDGRSDVYSLGCVLYEMLAGRPPYTAATPRAVMAMHWMDDIPSLRSARSSVRASIDSLVRKAMAKRPEERFASAREFQVALQGVSTEEKLAGIGHTPSDDQPSYAPSDSVVSTHVAEVSAIDASSLPALAHARSPASGAPASSGSATSKTGGAGLRGFALGALAVVAVVLAGWRVLRPREAALDRSRVMVYPLLVPDDFKGSRNVGEDIGTMIGSALDGAGNLRWIDGWPLLTPAMRQDMRNLSGMEARRIARSRRAAWYLMGRIITRGDSSEIFLELNDVEGDSAVAGGRAIGLTSDAWRTGLHAVNSLLPALIPPGTEPVDLLADWNDRDPAAVASFLFGESAFRRVHLSDALQGYRDALKADSTFSLAAVRGAQAATWNHRPDEAESFIQSALRQKMSPRYTHFAQGYQAYLAGAADSAAAEFRRAIAIDPELSVAWMQLGEVYTHLLPVSGNLDSIARIAFDVAYRLDPSARNLLLHPIEIRLRAGETEAARPMIGEFLSSDPDSVIAHQVRLMDECARSGPQKVRWTEAARTHPLAVLAASNSFKGGGSQLPCAISGYEAVLRGDTAQSAAGRRWSAVVGLASAYLVQGRAADARVLLDSSVAHGGGGSSFYLMAGPLYPEMQAAARATTQRDGAAFGADYAAAPYPLRLWQLGVWEAFSGRQAVAEAVAQDLAARARASKTSADSRLARSMAAFATLAAGDSAAAMRKLDSLVAEPVPGAEIVWDLAAPRGMERLTLSRMLAARGDYRKAIEVANVFDAAWPSIYLLYIPASLQLRMDAASALPDRRAASRFRSRLSALRGERAVAGK
jgi:serine/threonine protein kinase/tetratricopeptide (TPR) repeat protein